jgi:hypothetical protein
MTSKAETNTGLLKRLWTKFMLFMRSLEGADDPTGYYMLSLAKRIEELERAVGNLQRQLYSRADGSGTRKLRSDLGQCPEPPIAEVNCR